MSSRKISSFAVQTLVVSVLAIIAVVWSAREGMPIIKCPDSADYLAYVQYLKDGAFLSPIPNGALFHPLVMRTPGYPIFLTLASFLTPFPFAVPAAHFIVALAALFIVMRAMRPFLPPLLSGAAAMLAVTLVFRFFFTALSEWAASCALLSFFALFVLFLHTRSRAAFSMLTLLALITFLIRPALIIIMPFVLIALVLAKANFRHMIPIFFGVVVAPLVALAALNYSRTRTFTPTSYGSLSLFGIALLLEAPPAPSDDPVLASFIEKVVANRDVAIDNDVVVNKIEALPITELDRFYSDNLTIRAQALFKSMNLPLPQGYNLMRRYIQRVLLSHFMSYERWVSHCIKSASLDFVLGAAYLVIAVCALFSAVERAIPVALIVSVLVHLFHIIVCSLLVTPLERYLDVTRVGVVFLTLCMLLRLVTLCWAQREVTVRVQTAALPGEA